MKTTDLTNGAFPSIWIRLPGRGHCPYTGLTRPFYYQLIADGVIRSACLRKPGALRGTRLVWLPSVLAHIEKHIDTVGAEGGVR